MTLPFAMWHITLYVITADISYVLQDRTPKPGFLLDAYQTLSSTAQAHSAVLLFLLFLIMALFYPPIMNIAIAISFFFFLHS